jgi:hypothetical protein
VKSVTVIVRTGIEIMTAYFSHSTAAGALFSFVNSEDVDFSRSFLLALDRSASQNHTLPFHLDPGHYRVCVYDIEQDGTLLNGVVFPADMDDLNITHKGAVY